MKCGRCGADASVEKHTVDGFSGYVCRGCLEVWTERMGC